MMNDLVPVITSAQKMMATHAFKVWPRSELPALADGCPRTIVIVRLQAAPLEVEALVGSLVYMFGPRLPVLALGGGGASATYKAHPEAHKDRFKVIEEELETGVIDLRLKRSREHFIAVFDPNRILAALTVVEMLAGYEVPVDLIYVAERTEMRFPFVERCREKGIEPIIAEQYMSFSDKKDDRLYFPAIPRQLSPAFQEGELLLEKILDQTSPHVRSGYERSLAGFANDAGRLLRG